MICGVDEAGRGCIAGALYLAGVILFQNIPHLKDSKKLTRTQRFQAQDTIKQYSQFLILSFSPQEIDQYGLSSCLKQGLETIYEKLQADEYLFDGNTTFGASHYKTIIKGDNQISEIKAASILAKCAKDTEMLQWHEIYPEYGFNKHCGYGTKQHIHAIQTKGYLPIHRKSFQLKALKLL